MNQCPWCAREIPESATVCEHCGPDTALPIPIEELPVDRAADQFAPPPPPAGLMPPTAPRMSRTHLLAILAAVVGGGTVTFAMLMATGSSSSDAAGRMEPRTLERVTPAPKLTATGPKWSAANNDWVGNQRRAVAFEVRAENKVPIWQRQAHPILVVRCVSNRTDVFVFTESAAKMEPQDENHTVRIGFDEDPEFTERWPDSDDHDALFAPDGATFARRLTQARTLRFGFTPHNAAPVMANFQVSGLGNLIEPVARQCGWKK
jgi:hypothetical protein